MVKFKIIVISSLMLTYSAFGWQEGATEKFPLDCVGFPKNGAEKLYIKVTAESGSYGTPYLIGTKNDTEVWELPFPSDQVNLAKFYFSCKSSIVTLLSADPGPNNSNKQMFSFKHGAIHKHLQFEKGKNFGEAYKKLAKGAEDHYLLQVKSGQKMKVTLDNKYPVAIFSIFEPKSVLAIEETEYKYNKSEWVGILNKSGEYTIVVKGVSDESNYYLKVEVN